MSLIKWQPMKEFERMERIFEDALARWGNGETEPGAWNPRVNVFEKDDEVIVEADLPGVKKEDIEVRLENHTLLLKGERQEDTEVKEDDYYRHERHYGHFVRTLALPNSVEAEDVKAKFKDGVLTLTLPKAEEARTKRVEIQ